MPTKKATRQPKFSWRQQLVKDHIPWVTYLPKGRPCTGFMGHTSMKQVREGREPKCKNTAHWKFRALKRKSMYDVARDGIYCWNHLFSRGFYGGMDEDARLQKWFKAHPEITAKYSPDTLGA